MALILTFLGKGGVGCTKVAIAAAKQLSGLGSRVLFVGQDPSPTLSMLLGVNTSPEPTEIAPNLRVVQINSTILLEQSWEEVKALEAKYLRSPTLKNVYGQELGILPGMDSALALNAVREYENSGKYDVIIYDGTGDLTTLRMLGIPEILSWYIRRFRQVFSESDIGKALSPFVQPVTSAIMNMSWSAEDLTSQPTNQANELLDKGKKAIADPNKVAAYLVTNNTREAVATAKYLWGSAQQIGLTVGGVLLNQGNITSEITTEFAPLPITELPQTQDWETLVNALPNLKNAAQAAPKPIIIDTATSQVRVFLPGFDKKQVKLTQYGPEITVEAGDQRRNILLPPSLSGKPVKGAKFQEGYLIITL